MSVYSVAFAQGQERVRDDRGGQKPRFFLLDGLRGFAALLVVLYHVPPYLRRWFYFPNSFLAVDFFFCLSGFIIAYSYEKRILSGMSLLDFGLARLIRLYPLYLLGTTLGFLSFLFLIHGHQQNHWSPGDSLIRAALSFGVLPYLTRVPGNHSVFPFDGPAWSLFFELFANLTFWFAIRSRIATRFMWLAVTISCFSFLSLHGGALAEVGAFSQTFVLGFARVGFSFCMGVIVFRIYQARIPRVRSARRGPVIAFAVTGMLSGMLLARGAIVEQPTALLLCIAVGSPLTVYSGALVKIPKSAETACRILGDFSYPLYILHQPFLLIWGGHRAHAFAAAYPVCAQISLPVFCLVVAGISWCAGSFYDAPIRARLVQLCQTLQRNSPPQETQFKVAVYK